MNALQTWKIWLLAAILSLGILTAFVAVMPQFATAEEGSSTVSTESATSSEAGSAPTTKDNSSSTQNEATASSAAKSTNEEPSSSTVAESTATATKSSKAFEPAVAAGLAQSDADDQQAEGSPLVIDKQTVIKESQVWTGGMVRIVDGGSIVVPAGVELTLDSVVVDLSGFEADGYCFVVKQGGKLVLTGTTQISGYVAEPAEADEQELESSSSASNATEKVAESGIVTVQRKGALVLADKAAVVDNTSTAKGSDLIRTAGEVAIAGEDYDLSNNTTDPKKEGEADTPEEVVAVSDTGTIVRQPALMANEAGAVENPDASESESTSSSSTESTSSSSTESTSSSSATPTTKTVKLIWNDFQNKSNKRPDSVTVKLLPAEKSKSSDGSAAAVVVAKIPISASDKTKDEISYDVTVEEGVTYDMIALEEEGLAGYKVTPNNTDLTLTFDRASILIKKTWKPEKDPKGNRGPVVVKLKGGEQDVLVALSEKKLSEDEQKKLKVENDYWVESWVALVTDLDYNKKVEKDGKTTFETISYQVEEDKIDGYMTADLNYKIEEDPLKSLMEKHKVTGKSTAIYGCEVINKLEGTSSVTVSTSTIKATGSNVAGKGLASTGDTTNVLLVAIALLGSLTAAGFALARRRTE